MAGRVGRIGLPAVALGVALLTDRGLWGDERHVLENIASWTPVELVTELPQRKAHFPTWYFVPELLGFDVTLWLSLLAAPVAVYATLRAGEVLFDRRSALLAGGLMTLSPFLAEQSGWLRMYAPLTAVMAVGLWLSLERRWRAAAMACVAASTLHVFGWFAPAWLAAVSIRERPRYAAGVLAAGSAPNVVLFAYKGLLNGAASTSSTNVSHGVAPSLLKATLAPLAALTGGVGLGWLYVPAAVLAFALVLYPADRRLLAWVGLPTVGIALGSYLFWPVFVIKYYGFVAPAMALLAVDTRKPRRQRATVVGSMALLMALSWIARLDGAWVARRFWLWW